MNVFRYFLIIRVMWHSWIIIAVWISHSCWIWNEFFQSSDALHDRLVRKTRRKWWETVSKLLIWISLELNCFQSLLSSLWFIKEIVLLHLICTMRVDCRSFTCDGHKISIHTLPCPHIPQLVTYHWHAYTVLTFGLTSLPQFQLSTHLLIK